METVSTTTTLSNCIPSNVLWSVLFPLDNFFGNVPYAFQDGSSQWMLGTSLQPTAQSLTWQWLGQILPLYLLGGCYKSMSLLDIYRFCVFAFKATAIAQLLNNKRKLTKRYQVLILKSISTASSEMKFNIIIVALKFRLRRTVGGGFRRLKELHFDVRASFHH